MVQNACRAYIKSAPAGWPGRSRIGRNSDRDLEGGDLADGGGDREVDAHPTGGQYPDGPVAGCGEEPEDALVAGDDLAGELTGGVEQAGVGAGHRVSVTGDGALDDSFVGKVDGRGDARRLRGRCAALSHFHLSFFPLGGVSHCRLRPARAGDRPFSTKPITCPPDLGYLASPSSIG